MKPSKAGENMWLWTKIANQILKQKAQTQDSDGMQTFSCVIYDTVRGYLPTLILLIGAPSPQPPRLC